MRTGLSCETGTGSGKRRRVAGTPSHPGIDPRLQEWPAIARTRPSRGADPLSRGRPSASIATPVRRGGSCRVNGTRLRGADFRRTTDGVSPYTELPRIAEREPTMDQIRNSYRRVADREAARRRRADLATHSCEKSRLERVVPELRDDLAEAEQAGLLDEHSCRLLDAFERELVEFFDAEINRLIDPGRRLGLELAATLLNGKSYQGRRDAQIATHAAAVYHLLIERSFYTVLWEVMRRSMLAAGPLRPQFQPNVAAARRLAADLAKGGLSDASQP